MDWNEQGPKLKIKLFLNSDVEPRNFYDKHNWCRTFAKKTTAPVHCIISSIRVHQIFAKWNSHEIFGYVNFGCFPVKISAKPLCACCHIEKNIIIIYCNNIYFVILHIFFSIAIVKLKRSFRCNREINFPQKYLTLHNNIFTPVTDLTTVWQ